MKRATTKKAGKHCSKAKYKAAFKKAIKHMSFAAAVRHSWKIACRK